MSLRFILTRHAKSDWDAPDNDDHERPLSPRGQKASSAMGKWLSSKTTTPDQVLCSSATRARQTLKLMSENWAAKPEILILPELYLAEPQVMLEALAGLGQGDTVMMVAHNPGSSIVAQMLTTTPPNDPDFARYPTGFTTVFDFDLATWKDVDWAKGKVAAMMAPRRLET